MQKHTTSRYNEKILTRREMNGNGIGRGKDSDQAIFSLESLLQERKQTLLSCELRWNAEFSEDEKIALLNLREIWTRQRIIEEHKNPWFSDKIFVNRIEFMKYRMKRGDFKDDLPEDYEFSKEVNDDSF